MKKIFIIFVGLMFTLTNFAQKEQRLSSFNLDKKNVAIQGYDPVAYFTQNQAVKGNSAYAVIYEGVIYYFTSDQNKQTFLKAPAKFEPAYGGWCAFAMGKTGEKVEVDPTSFEVKDGHLFLFYKSWTNNTLSKWKDDEANLNKKADANWQKLFH